MMFTGIVQHVGILLQSSPSADGARLTISTGPLGAMLGYGKSLAVNGVCLTCADSPSSDGTCRFDVMRETLDRTTLGGMRAGSKVNLEPAMALGDRLDGHIVQGHVDGLAKIVRVVRGGQWTLEFSAAGELTAMMVEKGSVAIDGVSLTIVSVSQDKFSVSLIPTTLGETTLANLNVGDAANIETDIVGKYIVRMFGPYEPKRGSGGLTMDKLRDAGFI